MLDFVLRRLGIVGSRPSVARGTARFAVSRVGIHGSRRSSRAISGAGCCGMERSRRSIAPGSTTKDSYLQVVYGSDGTRTRDLRRDRPVMALPGWAGIG